MTYEQRQLQSAQAEYAALPQRPRLAAADPVVLPVRMRDGAALRTVISRPAGNGPFPTILVRSCYPRDEPLYRLHAAAYSARGFAFVYQFCRGTGGSEGLWQPNENERSDGSDTLAWLTSQAWAGEIGYFGCSYLALTGWAVADIVPEQVKTLYLTHYGTDRFESAYRSGCFRQDVLTSWAMENAGQPIHADFYESAAFRPQVHVDESLWGCRLDWYRDWITHTERSDPYWTQGFWGMLRQVPSRVRRPVYLGAGWYDHHLGSMLLTWSALSEESRRHSTLRIGAWNHDFQPCTPGQKTEHLQNSDIASAFSWFTAVLKEHRLPAMQVRTYQIGADRWQSHPGFPFPSGQALELFLSADGALALSAEEAVPGVRRFVFDPQDPVRSHGGEALLYSWDDIGSLPQPPCGWREDVLSFVSAPLTQPVELLGCASVTLFVSTDGADTAFTAKLMEVRPDGTAYHVRSGIATLGFREGLYAPRTSYIPGTVVPLEIRFWDINWRFPPGARLRLDISSSDFPQYSVHSNSAGIWSEQERTRVAHQSVFCGGSFPSMLTLPVQGGYTEP